MVSPSIERTVRAMGTTVVVMRSLVVAGALVWSVRRRESGRLTIASSACARVLDDVFAGGAADVADSLLLARLLAHRDACIAAAAYVDQARRLMPNVQRVDEARALLAAADARHAFAPDELAAQVA